jgi:hypothetical protein
MKPGKHTPFTTSLSQNVKTLLFQAKNGQQEHRKSTPNTKPEQPQLENHDTD